MTTHRKPGDVASTPEGRALLTERADGTAPAWITEQGVVYAGDVRPLAVLDHADQRAVSRLCGLMLDAIRGGRPGEWSFDVALFTDALAIALQRYVEPAASKPVEPLEVGSIVTDTTGHVWARTSWDIWQCLSHPDVEPATWDQLDVAPEQP